MKQKDQHLYRIPEVQNEDTIWVMAQAIHGNRASIEIYEKDIDGVLQGCPVDPPEDLRFPIDQTIVRIPDTEDLFLMYNKYQEGAMEMIRDELLVLNEHDLMPMAVILAEDLVVYSRCIVLRMDPKGQIGSLREEDVPKCIKYLAP